MIDADGKLTITHVLKSGYLKPAPLWEVMVDYSSKEGGLIRYKVENIFLMGALQELINVVKDATTHYEITCRMLQQDCDNQAVINLFEQKVSHHNDLLEYLLVLEDKINIDNNWNLKNE